MGKSGVISGVNGSALSGATVSIMDLRTGESVSDTTNSAGEYTIEIGTLLPNGVANSDKILIRVSDSQSSGVIKANEIVVAVNTVTGSTEQDLTVIAAGTETYNVARSEQDVMNKEHSEVDNAKRVIQVGRTSDQKVLPMKMVDDGSGLGKFPFSYE